MADITVLVKVAGADVPTAVEAVKEVGAHIKDALDALHHVVIKVQVYCERCGGLMVVKDKHLVCDACLEDEAQERALDYRQEEPLLHLPAFRPAELAETVY